MLVCVDMDVRLKKKCLPFRIYCFSFASRLHHVHCTKQALNKLFFSKLCDSYLDEFGKPAFQEFDIIAFIFYTLHFYLFTVDLKWPLQ